MSDQPLIFVVAEDASTSDLYRHRLADDYEVRTVADREKAIELIDEDVSVVLVERSMPNLVDDDFLTIIRQNATRCRAALITGVRPEENVLERGFDAALVKPVTAAELNETVERLLRRAEYDACLEKLTAIQSRRAELEERYPPAELADHDEHRELTARFERRRDELEELVEGLDDVDLSAVLHSLSW